MHTTHVSSGGRYPVLRAVAILFMVGAAGIVVGGVYGAVVAFQLPDSTVGRLGWAMLALASTFFGVLTAVGMAELIKLFIDVEHNTRMAATQAFRAQAAATLASASASPAAPDANGPDGKAVSSGGRVGQWLEGEETAEGALLRGH